MFSLDIYNNNEKVNKGNTELNLISVCETFVLTQWYCSFETLEDDVQCSFETVEDDVQCSSKL